MSNMINFNFVIARPWEEDCNHLCTYMFFNSEVHYGNMEDAERLLEHILEKEDHDDYKIYILRELE